MGTGPRSKIPPYDAYRATQRSSNAPRRCNCCFLGHATLQQRSWTLQLLLPDVTMAATGATQRCCNISGLCNCCSWGHATLSDAATAASGATLRSCSAFGRCKCCFWGH